MKLWSGEWILFRVKRLFKRGDGLKRIKSEGLNSLNLIYQNLSVNKVYVQEEMFEAYSPLLFLLAEIEARKMMVDEKFIPSLGTVAYLRQTGLKIQMHKLSRVN